jgi:signal transduction histidine kinase
MNDSRSDKHADNSRPQIRDIAFDYSSQGFVIWDNQQNLVDWNDKCAEFWYPPTDILHAGMPMVELLLHIAENGGLGPGNPKDLAQSELQRIVSSGPSSEDAFKMLDGRTIHVQRHSMQDGGHISTYTDISESEQAKDKIREIEQRFKTLYEQSPSGVCLEDYSLVKQRIDKLSSEGVTDFCTYFLENTDELKAAVMEIRLLDANRALIEMVGATSLEEYQEYEEDFEFWEHSAWRKFYANELSDLASGKLISADIYEDINTAGEPMLIRCTSQIVEGHENDWAEIITTHEDITEQKRAEIKSREATATAKESNRAKSEFLANMSHELRTPLNAIIGFSQLLQAEVHGPVGSDNNKEYVDLINGAGSHLLDIIGDILDLSKVEAGEVTLFEEKINLSEVIDECRQMTQDRASSKGVSFIVDVGTEVPPLLADKLKVKQILLNLLSNAIKFTPAGGEVKTIVTLDTDNSVVMRVQDSGIGISADDLKTVTEPFAQVGETNTRSHDGTGLGLSLVKSLIELHGGTIVLESTLKIGTTVSVHFPKDRNVEL